MSVANDVSQALYIFKKAKRSAVFVNVVTAKLFLSHTNLGRGMMRETRINMFSTRGNFATAPTRVTFGKICQHFWLSHKGEGLLMDVANHPAMHNYYKQLFSLRW